MRKVLFLFSVIAICVAQLADAANRAPVVYDITPLMTDPSGEIPLIGGKTIRLDLRWNNSRVLFEDKMPGANWTHPAAFKVVTAEGKVVQEVAADRPPFNLNAAKIVSGEMPNVDKPKFTLNTFDKKYYVKNPEKFHAILINGHADQRHWNDHSFLYRTLTQIYGYKQENIIVVDGVYKDRLPDMDDDGDNDITHTSTLAGIREAMKLLAERVKQGDQVILSVNDHGGKIGNESTIVAYDGEMKVSEFKKLLADVKADRVLTMYEQCYSGGFVRPSTSRGRVSMAAARDDEYSWASSDLLWDAWIYQAIVAFAMQTHDGKSVDVDKNRDGRVSATEAFAYSVLMDDAAESPLLESAPNSGNAPDIGLGF